MRHAFVTGSAGFIGYHLCGQLLDAGWRVTGYDGMTPYYDVALKRARHARLAARPGFAAHEAMLEDRAALMAAVAAARPDVIVHLAAQAGVRYSIEAPRSYLDANVIGSFHVLEAAREAGVAHLLMASTSSVYGAATEMPYAETARADTQMSFYAATKRATEAMAHAWAHIHGLPVTMFRFFTVYGPWGRPDMALFRFTEAILEGRPIDVYNHGEMWRDFTYVGDLVRAVVLLIDVVPEAAPASVVPEAAPSGVAPEAGQGGPDSGPEDGTGSGAETGIPAAPAPGPAAAARAAAGLSPVAPFRVVNIGNSQPVKLTAFIDAVEAATGRRAERRLLPMQPGDVPATWADATLLRRLTGYAPQTALADGVAAFVAWYRDWRGL